jgi:hypothetical protein
MALATKGDRVELDFHTDPYSDLQPGTRGTVSFVDSMGTVHVKRQPSHSWPPSSGPPRCRTSDSPCIASAEAFAIYERIGSDGEWPACEDGDNDSSRDTTAGEPATGAV